jgi:DNA-directed RNA polymerase subunit alpha
MSSVPDREAPIAELNLSVRAYNCLMRSGLRTVADVLRRSREELLGLRNFCANQYFELRTRLLELGFLPPDVGDGRGGAGAREPRRPRLPPSLSAAAALDDNPGKPLGTLAEALTEAVRGRDDDGAGAGTGMPRPHPLPPLPPASAAFDLYV